jgi:pimeloyl-ACP methyl ester carboxylesterase
LKGSPHALITTAQQLIPEDMNRIIDKYKSIKAPVLIIWGDKDTIVPLSIGEKLAGEISNAQFKAIERCGHVPQEECPEQTLRSIDAFLRDSR